MPVYTYCCENCDVSVDLFRSVEARRDPALCECGSKMKRVPERFVADTFEAYYDEGLGCDVETKAEKRRVMKELGVVEAGDSVHGGRNFDKAAPDHVKPTAPKGIKRVPPRGGQEQVVETVDAAGEVTSRGKFGDLESGTS
jgi:putative FmdB family regulatory protein